MIGSSTLAGSPAGLAGNPQPQKPDLNVMTPQEKMLRSERRRVEALVRGYQARPGRYDDAYINQLEQMSAEYGIPFQRAHGGALNQAGAAVGGFVDAFLFDLIPDSWYSSESTAMARKAGKGVGLATAALATGGTSLVGRGVTKLATTGLGKFTTAGVALGAKKALAPTIAGVAKGGGKGAGLAAQYMGSAQGKNIAKMSIKDITAQAKALVKGGDKGAALELIEKSGTLLTQKQKLALAKSSKAVTGKLETQIYQASQGIGSQALGGGTKTETLLNSILGQGKGVGPKSKKALDAVLKDKNKVNAIEKVLNDPATNIDEAVDAIRAILPKTMRKKLVNKSDMVKLLAEFYGFSTIGG